MYVALRALHVWRGDRDAVYKNRRTAGESQSVEVLTLSIVAVGTRCGSGKLFWSDSSARDYLRVSYKSEKLTSCRCLVCIAG